MSEESIKLNSFHPFLPSSSSISMGGDIVLPIMRGIVKIYLFSSNQYTYYLDIEDLSENIQEIASCEKQDLLLSNTFAKEGNISIG